MNVRAAALALVLLLVAAAVPPVTADAGADGTRAVETDANVAVERLADEGAATRTSAAAAATDELVREVTLALTPRDPGTIRAVVEYRTPESLASLVVTPGTGSVTEVTGFSRTSEGLEWDTETASPSFVLSIEVNETITGARAEREGLHATERTGVATAEREGGAASLGASGGAAAQSGGYSFVDVGAWAIVPIPQFSSRWTWYGSGTVTLSATTSLAGEGAVGDSMAYLGPEATHTGSWNDQEFRLVVPRAADLRESPSAILDSLTAASRTLQVGARDDQVLFIAAPTSVRWGPAGLEYGGSDAWVLADRRLDTAANVWIHEYVHTRQAYHPTSETRWTVEAIAEYYAALLTLKQDRIGFDAFAKHLRRGQLEPYRDAVLADPGTWTSANYVKGPLVYGNVDRAIRRASDGQSTAEDVLGLMNRDTDGSLTQQEFLSSVASVSTEDVADYARRYATTSATPDVWSRETHVELFSTDVPLLVSTIPRDGVTVTGPYRNGSFGEVPTLVVGETVNVSVVVANDGDQSGAFSAALLDNDTELAAASALVPPNERTTLSISHTFDRPGTYTLAVGYETRTVRVREPASPNATVAVNRTRVRPGGTVAVTLTASNAADYPARATYPVTVDGERVAEWTPTLAGNETQEFRTTVTFEETGTHTVRVGDRSFTVTVTDRTGVLTPGLGVRPAALAALLAALLVGRLERGDR